MIIVEAAKCGAVMVKFPASARVQTLDPGHLKRHDPSHDAPIWRGEAMGLVVQGWPRTKADGWGNKWWVRWRGA